ncbi:hypothetical protein AMQ84_09630 [Paenibacillus riograndensis]|uniref:Uncharacterized protein n=2 Tax=Paenibacillus riograndensis TaxID=483937 RepID=A0A132U4N0_9BACL|nr:hypothetical protein AMQ84_09630 [Paenibacillus riograndensis]
MVNRLLLSHLGSLLSFITMFAFSETSDAAANQWCREILLNEKRTVWRDGSMEPVRTSSDKLKFPPMDKNKVAAIAAHSITLSDKVQMFKFQIPLEWDKDEVKL